MHTKLYNSTANLLVVHVIIFSLFNILTLFLICKTAYRTYHMLLISDQIFLKNNPRKLFLYPNYYI